MTYQHFSAINVTGILKKIRKILRVNKWHVNKVNHVIIVDGLSTSSPSRQFDNDLNLPSDDINSQYNHISVKGVVFGLANNSIFDLRTYSS